MLNLKHTHTFHVGLCCYSVVMWIFTVDTSVRRDLCQLYFQDHSHATCCLVKLKSGFNLHSSICLQLENKKPGSHCSIYIMAGAFTCCIVTGKLPNSSAWSRKRLLQTAYVTSVKKNKK